MQNDDGRSDAGVSIIIPTLNREKSLLVTLEDLVVQTYRPMEIVIVDQSDATSDDVRRFVARFPQLIRYHLAPFRGLPLARNYGWRTARYPILLNLDDDIRCKPDLVHNVATALSDQSISILAGAVDEVRNTGVGTARLTGHFNRWTATPLGGFSAHSRQETDLAPGGNFAIRREILNIVGGIDENMNVGAALYEESDFCLRAKRAGHRIVFDPTVRLLHLAAPYGGCRVPDINKYIWSLSHNRAMLMRRHLSWYHLPTALARLAVLNCSYARNSLEPGALWQGLLGFISGWHKAGQPIRITGMSSD